MKRIAYIRTSNIYDDSRATKEISALTNAGYEVSILGWNRDGKAEEKTKAIFSDKENLVTCYFFDEPLEGGIGVKNVDKLIGWFRWTKKIVSTTGHYDGIHACNLDSALGVWGYAKRKSIKRIYDIYDYYLDSHSIPSIVKRFVENTENTIINESDLTIICTEERREQIKGSRPKKVVVIHNSPDVEYIEQTELLYDYAYCGSLFPMRLLKEVFDEYPNNCDLKFAVAGYGDFARQAEELAAKYSNFTYFGPLTYSEVIEVESKSRVISAIYQPTIRNHRLCAPNKFYEGLALGKPLIVCNGTGIDKIVQENNVGFTINYDVSEFYKAVRSLKEMSFEERIAIEKKAKDIYKTKYSWNEMSKRLLDVYSKI